MDEKSLELGMRDIVNELLLLKRELKPYTKKIQRIESDLDRLRDISQDAIDAADPIPKLWYELNEVLSEVGKEMSQLSTSLWALTDDKSDEETKCYLDSLSEIQTNLGRKLRGK